MSKTIKPKSLIQRVFNILDSKGPLSRREIMDELLEQGYKPTGKYAFGSLNWVLRGCTRKNSKFCV